MQNLADILIVVRVGVYDQGVVGVATDLGSAKAIAEASALEEHDCYHGFEVRKSSGGEFDTPVASFESKNQKERAPRIWQTPD